MPEKLFLPSDLRYDRLLPRVVTARLLTLTQPGIDPIAFAKATWPHDRALPAVVRAATGPASTTGWGAEVAGSRAVAEFIGSLRASAAARLITEGKTISLQGLQSVLLPRASTNPAPAWVDEGAPIPAGQGVITNVQLGPAKKLALIEAVTRDLTVHTAESVESIITQLMQESAARALDASLFSTSAPTTAQPAGLLYNVVPITASTSGGIEALVSDIAALVSSITTAGAGSNILLFLPKARAVKAEVLAAGISSVTIIPTLTLPADQMVAVDADYFVSGFGPEPQIDVSDQATVHMSTTPLPLSESGVVASPTTSAWQAGIISIRLLLRAAWATRNPGAVAYIASGLTW